jgi:hypothetical protein
MSRRRPKPPSKFITYFQLLDAFRETGCPVCRLLDQGAFKALDGLMYEQVNDPGTREQLVASHGFCNWHAWKLLTVRNSALGTALIYRHLLQETLDHLDGAGSGDRARKGERWLRGRLGVRSARPVLAWRRKKTRCFLCRLAGQMELDTLRTVLDFLREPEFAEPFTRCDGLCLPHLCRAVELAPDHPGVPALLEIHQRRWQDLVWELGEFARKFDYRYADEARGQENTSWLRALEALAGRAGLFGPERWSGKVDEVSAGAPLSPGDAKSGPAPEAEEEPGALESLRFEVEKLRRRIQALQAEREEGRKARLALEFKLLKLSSDHKIARVEVEGGTPIEESIGTDTDARASALSTDGRNCGDVSIAVHPSTRSG